MSSTDHVHQARLQESVAEINLGDLSKSLEQFSADVTFVVPGHSALSGTHRGRDQLGERFFSRMYELSGGTMKTEVEEVLANDHRMVLFLRLTAERDGERLNVTIAGFHDDLGPDGWRKATLLPDDLGAFDHFFRAA